MSKKVLPKYITKLLRSAQSLIIGTSVSYPKVFPILLLKFYQHKNQPMSLCMNLSPLLSKFLDSPKWKINLMSFLLSLLWMTANKKLKNNNRIVSRRALMMTLGWKVGKKYRKILKLHKRKRGMNKKINLCRLWEMCLKKLLKVLNC